MGRNDFEVLLNGIRTLNPNIDSSRVTIRFARLGELSPDQWQTFAQTLALYKNLETLCLSHFPMQFLAFPQTMRLFGGTLAQLKTLQCLDIRKTGVHKLSPAQLELLYSALMQVKSLRRVLGLESCESARLNAFYTAPLSSIIINTQNHSNRAATINNRRTLLAWCASIAKFFIDNRLPADQGGVTKIILDFLSPPKVDRRLIEQYLRLPSKLVAFNENTSKNDGEVRCYALGPMLWKYNDESSTSETEVDAPPSNNNLRKSTSCCTVC